jgi:ParB-like chromosome segregation protein Spo0J
VTAARRKPPERVAPAAKQAVDAPRRSTFMIRPERLCLIGRGVKDDDPFTQPHDTKDGPEHELYDPRALDDPDEEFAEDLFGPDGQGQAQPIVVRKNGDQYEVGAGRGRTLAGRLWNHVHPDDPVEIECKLGRGKNATEWLELMIAENEHRREVPIISKAKMAQRLLDRGRPIERVARLYRVEVPTLKGWLESLDFSPAIQAAMESGDVSKYEADKVADLPHKDQTAVLDLAREENTTLGEAAERAGVRTRQRGSSHNPSSRPPITEIRAELEDDTIADADIIGTTPLEIRTHILKWVLGDVPHLNRRPDADKDDAR